MTLDEIKAKVAEALTEKKDSLSSYYALRDFSEHMEAATKDPAMKSRVTVNRWVGDEPVPHAGALITINCGPCDIQLIFGQAKDGGHYAIVFNVVTIKPQ